MSPVIIQYQLPIALEGNQQRWTRATFFLESAIAIPQLEGSTSAIAIPQLFKEMLFRNRNSQIPQSQFFLMSATSSMQLESFISTIFGIFLAMESGRFMKKMEVKNLMQLSLKGKFLVSRETGSSKNICWLIF